MMKAGVWGIAAAVVIVIGVGAYFHDGIGAALTPLLAGRPQEAAAAKKAPGIRVVTVAAEKRRMPLVLTTIGTMQSPNSVALTTDVAGLVSEVAVADGAFVHKGDVLVKLDPRQAAANVARDEATVTRDQASLDSANLNLGRARALLAKAVATQQSVDDDVTAQRMAAASLDVDQATLKADRVTLANKTIVAPFDGRIGAVAVSPGAYVGAGTAVASLVEVARLQATFSLPEINLPDVQASLKAGGVPVSVIPSGASSGAASAKKGMLSFIDNQIDVSSATLKAYARLDNSDLTLWPGQTVTVAVQLRDVDAVAVPTVAVQSSQKGSLVFVATADRKAVARPVKVAVTDGDTLGITDGLKPGERVVVEGQLNVHNGSDIDEVDGAASASAAPKATEAAQ